MRGFVLFVSPYNIFYMEGDQMAINLKQIGLDWSEVKPPERETAVRILRRLGLPAEGYVL